MSLENLMAEDLSKTLGGKNKLGVMPMPVRTTPIVPAPAAVNPLIDAQANAPATAQAPAPEQTAPAIQSQPNTDRAERIRQRAASYPERPSGSSQYLGSGNTWRLERAQKEIDLEDQKAAAKEHLSWAGDSFIARNVQLGLRGVVDMGLGIKALAQHAVGSDEKAKETMKTIGERAETSNELSYGIVTSFDEAMSKGGFWNWVGSSILQQVPNMAASVATSGMGGFVGGLTRPAASAEIKAVGKNIISRSISDAVKKETARQIALASAAGKTVGESVARDAAEKIVRTKIGQQIGAFASGMALNTGENVSGLYNRTGEFNTVGSLTAGAVKGALDSLFTSKTAGKLFNPGSASRKAIEEFNKSNSKFVLGVLGGIIADSGIEGTTEGLQYLVDEFTVYAQKPENYGKKPEQIWTEFLDNAAAAAVSSMALSSVSTYRDESAKRAEAKAMSAAASPALDPNAPAVNPMLAPEAAQGASAFDVPIGATTATAEAPASDQAPVNPLLATNQPTTNEADAELVRRSMATRGEAYAGIRAVEPVPSAAVAAVKEVSDKIGVRVIWIDGAPVGGRAVQGAAATGENAIMLHTDLLTNPKRDPVMMVYAHELTHRSERTSPKDYGILRDSVLARPEAKASVEEKVAAGMGRAEAESEAVAEQVEVLGTDQAFWKEVFQGKDQSFVDHILAIIKDIADRVFGTNQAAKAEAIRGAAVQAFRAMQAQGQQTTDSALVNQPISEGVSSTPTTQEAQNGQVQGLAVPQVVDDVKQLPKLKQGYVRVVHEGSRNNREGIVGRGLDYSAQGMLQSNARYFGANDEITLGGDKRYSNSDAYVFDVPLSEIRMHDDVAKSPGVLPAKYIVGIVENKNNPAKGASNGQVQGQAQEVAQNDAIEAQKRREANARRRETREAKADRARLREEKRKAEIEYNKFRRNSGMSRREAAKARRIYDFDRGDTPILNLITDQFGGIRSEDAKAFEVEKAALPRSIREKLFPSNGKGSDWNGITWQIEHDNLIPGVLRADEVGAALSKEIKAIQSRAKEEKAQARAYRQRDEDERGFKRAIIRDDKNAKVRREAVDLREGDKLVRKIDGIPVEFTVTDVEDTTGNLVLRSTLYGRQPVEYFEMVHADKYIPAKDADSAGAAKAEEVPFSTKKDEPTLAETASEIEDESEREAFARAELERRAGIPIVAGPKNMAVLSQNHVVSTAQDLLARLEEGEIDAVGALESLEAVEGRVGLAMERADRKAAKAAKAAAESRQQTLPGVVTTPYGTQDDGSQGVLFSAKKLTDEDVEAESRRKSVSSIQSNRDAEYMAAVKRADTDTAQRIVDDAAKAAGYTERMFHGTDESRNIFDGGMFFTDSEKDASAYAEMKALQRAVEENDELSEIVYDVISEIGGEDITDLGPKAIADIADANGIYVPTNDGFVLTARVKATNPLDLREYGSDVGNVRDLWNDLNEKGLLDESWDSLDPETQQEIKDDYKGKALYVFLEKEGVQSKAFDSGYDALYFTDISPDGGSTHTSMLVKENTQFKSSEALVRDDAGRIIPPSERFNPSSDDIRFSLAKPEDGQGREREFSISRFFRDELKRQWSATYRQKSAQAAYDQLRSLTEKNGEDWIMEHLHDLSKESLEEFPLDLRQIAGRSLIASADKLFRSYGINDDGSNMPNDPIIEKMWNSIERLRREAATYEKESGRGSAFLAASYSGGMGSPVAVRKEINKIHDTLAAPVIGPVKMPVIDKVLNESKLTYDEAIAALEKERAENAILKEQLSSVHSTLKSANTRNLNRIFKMADESDAVRAAVDSHVAKILEELRAAGMAEGLSSKPDISLIQKIAQAYIWINRTTDEARVKAFLESKNIKIDDVAVSALVNDARIALGNAVRSAEKAAPRKAPAQRKGPTVLNRRPDMTIQPDELGAQRLFDSGKMWGDGVKLNIGEADAKRLALELTEAGQTIMRGISSNVEVVISNALRRGRNRAGLEKVLIESGIDERTAKRMARDITERRAALVRPALETLRKKYADKGDKVSRTIASAMDKIMEAMNLADVASKSQVSGFFDGNAWDESRRIVEEAFGFKSEITRDWFNETMRIYREYEKADEAGNHIKASELHRDLLNRVARVQHGKSGTGKWMAVRSYIQGGMLSGPSTHLWNLFNTASRNLEFALVQSERQLLRGNFRAAMAPWMILGQSSKQAFGVAKRIMREGVNPIGMRGTGDDAKFGTDPSVASATEWHPWFQNKALGGMKYIGRALIAADALFRTNIENTEIYVQAYQDAINRGDSPAVAAKQALGMAGFVTDGTNDAYNQAAKKADELGLKGIDRELNILIDMRNALDPEMREKALLQGSAETFNDQHPEGLVGAFADAVRHLSWHPAAFWLGMFARIGANVFNYGVQTSPLAFASLAIDATIGTYKNQGRYVVRGDELVKRSIRAVNGLAVSAAVFAMCLKAMADYDEDEDKNKKIKFMLTAKGPRNNDAAKKLWRQQNKPFMMIVNGKEYSYKWMGPIATPFAMIGALMDEIRFGDIRQSESDEGREGDVISRFLPTMLYGMMAITTEELPANSMVAFANTVYSAEDDSSSFFRNMSRFARDQITSAGSSWIPYSAMVRYLDRIAEPTVYSAKNMDGVNTYLYSFLRNIPIARKYMLYPMRNIFGEPIQVPDSGGDMGIGERAARLTFDRFLNNMQKDEDIQFLIKAQRSFKAPTREETQLVTNENGLYGLRKMTDAEYDRYLELFGKELRTQVAEVRTAYSSTAEAEKWVYKENKSLQKRLTEAKKTAMRWAMYKFMLEKEQRASSNKE